MKGGSTKTGPWIVTRASPWMVVFFPRFCNPCWSPICGKRLTKPQLRSSAMVPVRSLGEQFEK